jgi:hypothetical protein
VAENRRQSIFFWKRKHLPPKRKKRNSSAPAKSRNPLESHGNLVETPSDANEENQKSNHYLYTNPYTGPSSERSFWSDEENMPPPRRSKRLAKMEQQPNL